MKIIGVSYLKIFSFLVLKFSINSNRRAFFEMKKVFKMQVSDQPVHSYGQNTLLIVLDSIL